jgi:predicted nucleotidyltransferase
MDIKQWMTFENLNELSLEDNLDLELLSDILIEIFSQIPFEKAYLFGSYVWGEASPNSDIDLLILISDKEIGMTAVGRSSGKGNEDREHKIVKDPQVKNFLEMETVRILQKQFTPYITEKFGRIIHIVFEFTYIFDRNTDNKLAKLEYRIAREGKLIFNRPIED